MWIPDYDQAPYSTFTEPVPDPGTDPTTGPFVLCPIAPTWLPVVLGALQQLVQAGAWDLSTDAARLDVQIRAMQLIDQVAQAGTGENQMGQYYQHNDVAVAYEAGLDIEDSASVVATLTNDPTNARLKLSLAVAAVPALTAVSAALGGDVAMPVANTFYDGPSVTLSPGTWIVFAELLQVGGASITTKLWDGASSVLSSSETTGPGSGSPVFASLIGLVTLAVPATYKVSAASSNTGGAIKAAADRNGAGNNATTILAVKIG